jgi:hypothetical protein
MLVGWLRRALAGSEQDAPAVGKLVPATEVVARFRRDGGGPALALSRTRAQVAALRALVQDERGWARVRELVARAGDPWNADDWPDGFDPLLLCAALCDDVAFECARCPVGQRQDARSCAHPQTLFGSVLTMIARGDRAALLDHLRTIDEALTR